MKHCVRYPDDKFLAVRPCLVAICLNNRPAAKLLGTLLYRYNLRVENKDDAENHNAIKVAKGETPDQDTTYRIFRKQSQLVEDMCGEMTEKTLHDVAVPMLQLLGYIDLEEHMPSNCYIVNIERVQQTLDLSQDEKELEKFLISTMPLEKFLISTDELEIFLIDKKNFLSGLEKVLIYNRNISNHKRGRKVRPDAALQGKSRKAQNLKEDSKKNTKKRESNAQSASAIAPPTPAPSCSQNIPDGTTGTMTIGKTEKPKRTRKPKAKAEPVNPELQRKIASVFDTFDALARECFGDPEFSHDRSKVATEAITAFLALSPTPTVEKLKAHYRYLFKQPKSKDGFVWRDNMSIAAVLRDYGRKPKALPVEVAKAPEMSDAERDMAERRAFFANPANMMQTRHMVGVGGGR